MKANQKNFARAARDAARSCRTFYFCGPDESGAWAAVKTVVEMLPDAGERVELSGSDLKRDPVLLADEARSSSLFGGNRHILVRMQGDEALDAIGNHLLAQGQAWPVLVVASGATDKSRVAKLLEGRSDALVAIFYPPERSEIVGAIRQMGDAAGLKLATNLAERIASACLNDLRLAQSEVEKLALYLDASPQTPRAADAAALDAIVAASEEDSLNSIVNAVLGGDRARLPHEIARIRELSLNPVGVLLALERRAAQLAQLAGRLGTNPDVRGFVSAETKAKRIFWKEEREIAVQLGLWRGGRLSRLMERLTDLHRELIGNSQAAELLLAQGLTDIARAAAGAAAPRRQG
ncbi:MAG: DNA polymerase III subunit delta [Sphingomonadaceae bacterium]